MSKVLNFVALVAFTLGVNLTTGVARAENPGMDCATSADCGGGVLRCDKKSRQCVLPPGIRWADPFALAPVTAEGTKADWEGQPGSIPRLGTHCSAGTMPAVVGSTKTQRRDRQDRLDRIRASMMLAPDGGTAWTRPLSTPTEGSAAVYCVPAPRGVAKAQPVTTPRLGITEAPAKVRLDSDGGMVKSTDSSVLLLTEGGAQGNGLGVFGTAGLGVGYRQKAFVIDGVYSIMANVRSDHAKVGWDVTLRPGVLLHESVALKAMLGGGAIGPGLTASTYAFNLHVGGRLEFSPVVFATTSSWARLLTLYVGVEAAQVYHKGDTFTTADWSVQWSVGLSLQWSITTF